MHWDGDYREIPPPQPLGFPAANGGSTYNPVIYQIPNQAPSVPAGSGTTGQAGVNYASGETANRSVDPGSPDGAQQFPGGAPGYPGAYTGGGAYPGAGGFNPQQFGGGQPGAAPGQAGRPGAQGLLPQGIKNIIALQSDNSILVYGTVDGFKKVREIVKNLDIAPRQVQIKVEFVTALVSMVDQEGINWSIIPYPGVSIVPTLSQPSQPSISIQYASGSAAVSLLADLEKDHSKVVQSPIITTTNNVAASVSVSTQIPYTTDSVILGGNNNNNIQTTTQQFLNLTTGLTVDPRINSDDTVTLRLAPQVSTPGANTSSNNGPPPVTTQSLTTLRTIKSGETMVLGGLIAKTEERVQKRIPFLADLPIFGSIFRDRNIQTSDSELLIFVTATIIGEDTDGGTNITVSP
jgi:general secretion pathway protein D